MRDARWTGRGVDVKTIAGTIAVSALIVVYASLYASSRASLQEDYLQKDTNANALFVKNCASCHGMDGRAKTFKGRLKHVRDLTNSQWQTGISDEHIYNSILRGNGKMPAFGKRLS